MGSLGKRCGVKPTEVRILYLPPGKRGRADECSCLENRRGETHRGFESLRFRMRYLIGVAAVRNFVLGLTLVITNKLFLAPVFDGAFANVLGAVLIASAVITITSCLVRRPYLAATGLLIGDAILIYFFANRLFDSAQGLYGLPILLGALIAQDFGLIFFSAREEAVRAVYRKPR